MKTSWKIRLFDVLSLLLFLIIALFTTRQANAWLQSIDANQTLRLVIPIIIFAASLLGLWVLYNYLKIFIFQKKGLQGYLLRGRITLYFLLVTVGSILLVGGIMFYLIILIENSFIQGEQTVSQQLMTRYQISIESNKAVFESRARNLAALNLSPTRFRLEAESIHIDRAVSDQERQFLSEAAPRIQAYFSQSGDSAFYLGDSRQTLIIRQGRYYHAFPVPDNLMQSFLDYQDLDSRLKNLNVQQRNIRPISMAALVILSVPVLIAVFFISFFIARSITTSIEQIAEATKAIANGNLDFRVQVHSGDEIQELGNNLNVMAHRLKLATDKIKRMERLEAWQEMARRLAHEIKNPLTPIKLSAERLQYAYEYKKENFNEILEKTTGIVISEAARLENLVNEFSQFARLPYLNRSRKDIIQTLKDIQTFFQGAYPDFQIVDQFDPPSLFLDYDEDQIKQVIINIITNAIEACNSCEKHVTMITSAVNRFILAISDNSGGIPEDIRDKVFEPYFTSKSGGTGLGLAIAERIIVEHEGNIWFQVEGNGTIFYIELPLPEEAHA